MKLKSLILSFAFTLFAVSGLLAQDKYEYATVIFRGTSSDYKFLHAQVSYSTGEFKKLEWPNPEGKSYSASNNTAVLKFVSEMSLEGWEVINFTTGESATAWAVWSFLLKRKIK